MAKSTKRIALIIVVAAIGLSIAAFALDRAALSATYERKPNPEVSLLPTYELYQNKYPRTDVAFELDGYTLRGHVYGAKNDRGLIIFRHGMFSKHQDYLPLITALVDKGWRVFAYDAIGCGESDGESTLGMSQSPHDVAAAIDFARENGLADGMPLLLVGHSWGGYGVAAALEERLDVDACVTMSGFDTPMKILDYSVTNAYGPIGKLQWPFLWLNTLIDFGQNADISASNAIVSSSVPTLVIHGSDDTTAPFQGVSILDALQNRQGEFSDTGISFIVKEEPGRSGHNDYFYSPKSQAYLNECADALQALLDENGDDVTAPEVQDYLKTVDLLAANTADPALVDEIDAFLSAHLD